jgi:hypothetical protein
LHFLEQIRRFINNASRYIREAAMMAAGIDSQFSAAT